MNFEPIISLKDEPVYWVASKYLGFFILLLIIVMYVVQKNSKCYYSCKNSLKKYV